MQALRRAPRRGLRGLTPQPHAPRVAVRARRARASEYRCALSAARVASWTRFSCTERAPAWDLSSGRAALVISLAYKQPLALVARAHPAATAASPRLQSARTGATERRRVGLGADARLSSWRARGEYSHSTCTSAEACIGAQSVMLRCSTTDQCSLAQIPLPTPTERIHREARGDLRAKSQRTIELVCASTSAGRGGRMGPSARTRGSPAHRHPATSISPPPRSVPQRVESEHVAGECFVISEPPVGTSASAGGG